MKWTLFFLISTVVHATVLSLPFSFFEEKLEKVYSVTLAVNLAHGPQKTVEVKTPPSEKLKSPINPEKTHLKHLPFIKSTQKSKPATPARSLPTPPLEGQKKMPTANQEKPEGAFIEDSVAAIFEDDETTTDANEGKQNSEPQVALKISFEKKEVENVLTIQPIIQAQYAYTPKPKYPELARRKGWEGKVVLRVLVGREGKPEKIEISDGSGFPLLDQVAMQSVQLWRFHPARQGGKPLDTWIKVPIVFRLTE